MREQFQEEEVEALTHQAVLCQRYPAAWRDCQKDSVHSAFVFAHCGAPMSQQQKNQFFVLHPHRKQGWQEYVPDFLLFYFCVGEFL